MTRPAPASAPDDLFAAIATLLEPGQREYFYQRMLYFRHLRPEDELLRLVEAMGLLALLIREAPHAVALERERIVQVLETSLASLHAAANAGQAYQQQLDERLSRLPGDLAHDIHPEAIARAMTESLRQHFVHSGLPATADALTAIAQHVTQATGQLQRAAGQLRACTGIAEQAQGAMDRMTTSVTKATDAAQWVVTELSHQFRVECLRAVCVLCGAAWLLGMLGGIAFERWRGAGIRVVPQAIEVPAHVDAPSSPAMSDAKKATPAPARDRHREPHTPKPQSQETPPVDGTGVERPSNGRGTAASSEDAKPKA